MKLANIVRACREPAAFLAMRRHLLEKPRAAALGFDSYFGEQHRKGFPLERSTFRLTQRYSLDLNSPKSFNQCLVHRRLFSRDPIWTRVTDKVEVRNFIRKESEVGGGILVDELAVVDDPESLRGRIFPCACVIKAAWASGRNIFLPAGKPLSDSEIKELLRWQSEPYNVHSLIWASHQIPRRFLVERMLQDESGKPPRDFKFFVFDGEVLLIQVDHDRFGDHRRDLYDAQGRVIPLGLAYKRSNDPHLLLDAREIGPLREVAASLGRGFDFVRVDLYYVEGKVYFGEMTQTPGRGHEPFTDVTFDRMLGEVWQYHGAQMV